MAQMGLVADSSKKKNRPWASVQQRARAEGSSGLAGLGIWGSGFGVQGLGIRV